MTQSSLDTNIVVSVAGRALADRTSASDHQRRIPRGIRAPGAKIRKGLRQQMLQFIRSKSRMVEVSRAIRATKDPDDNKFLVCAETARAD